MAAWQMSKLDITTLVDPDLDQRIAAAFGDVKSDDVKALIVETEAATVAVDQVVEQTRERALDPKLSVSAVAEARRQMDDSAFRSARLKTAVSRLHKRLKEVRAQEEDQRRWIAYEKVKAERDKLAAELKASYPSIECRLGPLIAEIEANDRMIEYVNSQALPRDAERLRSAELVARDIEAWRVNGADVIRITRELCVPSFKHDQHKPYAWPRSR
jgi:hypothetical protein